LSTPIGGCRRRERRKEEGRGGPTSKEGKGKREKGKGGGVNGRKGTRDPQGLVDTPMFQILKKYPLSDSVTFGSLHT